MDRRTFLKLTGAGSIAVATGCNSHPERHLYTLVQAPEDMVTGEPAWYASTCRECPAGCGILAKNREGRAIKLEGNPLHPVNQGKLCARGQAALQGVYNPDRITEPRLKTNGQWQRISFADAGAMIQQRMQQAAAKGPDRIALMTEVVGDCLLDLFGEVLRRFDSSDPVVFEPFAFESLKFAHAQVFGDPILPSYRMEQADLLVSLGADFLETWLSPVEYARKFKAMHALADGQKGRFFCISPQQSLTAANADQWIACRPGSEALVVMGLIRAAIQRNRDIDLPTPFRAALHRLAKPYSMDKVGDLSGVQPDVLNQLALQILNARRPLVLPTGTAAAGSASVAADLTTVLLNAILDPRFSLYDVDQRHRVEIAHSRDDIQRFWQNAAGSSIDVVLLNNVNPVYALPGGGRIEKILGNESLFSVAFSNFMDETAAAADLVFPTRLSLETWDVYESKQAMAATVQPVMGQIHAAPGMGDFFLQLLPLQFRPAEDYPHYVSQRIARRWGIEGQREWLQMVQNGGRFVADQPATKPVAAVDRNTVDTLAELLEKIPALSESQKVLYVTPSLRFYDGRGANRPWLPEIPEPITQVAWQSVALVPPAEMRAAGWSDGDPVLMESEHGRVRVQVYAYHGLHADAVVLQGGQGHTHYGRYAGNQGINPVALLGDSLDHRCGAPDYSVGIRSMQKDGAHRPLAQTSGSRVQYGRKIALSVSLADAAARAEKNGGLTMNDFPFTPPLPEGYDHLRDIYAPHDHQGYRWGMVVDLDRCIGCNACVAACYAENNVGVVGETRIIEGREMAWLRIERYEDPQDPGRLMFLPMMCQHCDNAPCESVCPVYAPHHSKEGLNNQIYNRCIGTRFCAQNCPYKVRRFNWFDWQWPEPLNLQLNPNVTVRSKGVMEKCSFCIQRIKETHDTAKNEERAIRDGEVIPACVQTCPTDALFFGNLMDPGSTVRRLMADPRAYQVMGYLNTKPAVIYLKKVVQRI
jgi:anaerobic selenocysteine-containing dehydrogenase/Fe-S-cluster-containing dehydrogenase component